MTTIILCEKLFYKHIGYFMIDQNNNNDTWNIRKQAGGYIILMKRKQIEKVKVKGCAEGHYHQKFNHKLESNSLIVISCLHVGSYVMNTLVFEYKLRCVFGQEDDFTTNK